jgi:hypothetical protein
MRPNAGRKRTMMSDADALDHTRGLLDLLVSTAERANGSRMRAYDMVAREIGRTPEWVRKLMGRRAVNVKLRDGWNIAAAYDALCSRIDAEAENNRRRTVAAREIINAALASTPHLVANEAGADRGRARGEG